MVTTAVPFMRTGTIWSIDRHFAQTRAGGRCRSPHTSHCEPVNPNFHSSARNDGGAAGDFGSGRRGGSRCRKPRQVRKVW